MAQSDLLLQFALVCGGLILLLLLGTGGVVLTKSVTGSLADRRERAARDDVTEWFETRRRASDPAWRSSVPELSAAQREVLVDLFEETLRNPSDSWPPAAWELATALGVAPALEDVPQRRRERLRELTWAVLLRYDADPLVVEQYVSDARDEREAAARLLLFSSDPAASVTATELLLRDGPMSVFSLDTLYQHHQSDASALVEAVADSSESMSDTALAQTLAVAAACGAPADRWVEWTTRQRAHDSERVRVAAARALDAWETATSREYGQDIGQGLAGVEQKPSPEMAQRLSAGTLTSWSGVLAHPWLDHGRGDDR